MIEIESPISMTDLAERLGVEQVVVDLTVSDYATRHGERVTFADVDAGAPYVMLTVSAAQSIADQIES